MTCAAITVNPETGSKSPKFTPLTPQDCELEMGGKTRRLNELGNGQLAHRDSNPD